MGELFSELGQAADYLADPIYWVAVFGAVFVAAFTGMIPGASGVIVMALSIPFIVEVFGSGNQKAIGLVMLASMTGVNNTLDSIPAILFGQPSAATQVTFLEGHQLARQGRAAHTLGAVYAVSALGGIVGALVLALLIPVSRPVILAFTPAEVAAVAFFGVAMVAALSAGAMVKGLTAGAFGILLGTVGINPITGALRFVFDQPQLWNGLGGPALVAVVIGFFALPEMIDLSIARRPVAPPGSAVGTREVLRGARDGLKRWRVMIRQSVFGVLMGAIPGVGAAVIDWLSYAFGIFWTKDKSQFGKGSLDGVLFAESAQNSKEAGQALPTLALGVPGGLAWVLVFYAMVQLDLTPGPRLVGDLADVTILFVITLAIGNLIVTSLGILVTGQLAKLIRIPYPLFGGVFIPITILASVVNMTSYLAIPIIFVFAGIGIIMKLFQWPRPPLLLGIILGPIIEEKFLSAMSLVDPVYRFFWINLTSPQGIAASRPSDLSEALGVLARPLVLALVIVAVATAVLFARSSRNQPIPSNEVGHSSEDGKVTISGASGTEPQGPGLLARLFHPRNFPVLLAIGGAAAFYWGSLGFDAIESWFVPRAMAILVILLALVQLIFHLRSGGKQNAIMDLGMHSLVLPGAKQAIILIATAFLLFTIVTGTIGLRWGTVALAGYLPFALLARVGSGAQVGIGGGVTAGALAGAAAAFFGDTGMAELVVMSASVAVAVAVAFIIEAQGVGGIPTKPMTLFIAAVAFGVAVLIVAVRNPWPPYLLAVALLPLAPLFIRPFRELQPSQSIAWLFSWRLLGAAITMGFVVIFEFVLADNVLFPIWPQPALIEWISREILVPLGLQSA